MLSIFQVSTIFIDGLPATWDEDHVRDHLKKFGRIEKIELARNMPAAKRMDFGFVTFDNHDAAVACVDSINNTELGDGERLVSCAIPCSLYCVFVRACHCIYDFWTIFVHYIFIFIIRDYINKCLCRLYILVVVRDSKCPVFLEFRLSLGIGNVPEPLALLNYNYSLFIR